MAAGSFIILLVGAMILAVIVKVISGPRESSAERSRRRGGHFPMRDLRDSRSKTGPKLYWPETPLWFRTSPCGM